VPSRGYGSPNGQYDPPRSGHRGGSTMPDTATSAPAPSGLAPTISMLLLIVGHAVARRSRHPDRGQANEDPQHGWIRLR
jgi:hypothetical protein